MKVHVKVPATSANLGVGLDCLAVALDIWNELTVEEASEDEVIIDGEGDEELPRDSRNLVVRSFWSYISRVKRLAPDALPRFRFFCKNNIPLERGLGSSAAAIVAGLVAAAALEPHLQSRIKRELPPSTLPEGQPYNCAPTSSDAETRANSANIEPGVCSAQCSTEAVGPSKEKTTCSCLHSTSHECIVPDNNVLGNPIRPAQFSEVHRPCVPGVYYCCQRDQLREGVIACCVKSTATVLINDRLASLLQTASELEGHADNVAAALYGGLRLTLTYHCTRDDQAGDSKSGIHKSSMCPAKRDKVLTSGSVDRNEEKAFTTEIGERLKEANMSIADVPSRNKDTNTLCDETCSSPYSSGPSTPPEFQEQAKPSRCPSVESTDSSSHNESERSDDPDSATLTEKCITRKIGLPQNLKLVLFVPEDRLLTEKDAGLDSWLQEAMNDKLHQPYRRALNPHLEPLTAAANKAGALGTALSGAGPSVIAFCMAHRAEEVASAMRLAAQQIEKAGRVLATDFSEKGAHIVDFVVFHECHNKEDKTSMRSFSQQHFRDVESLDGEPLITPESTAL